MADALASGASGSNTVWVQVPSPAFNAKEVGHKIYLFCVRSRAPHLLHFYFLDIFILSDKMIKNMKRRIAMDLLKKYWPHAFKANDIVGLIITIIIYAVIDIVVGWLIGIVALLPIINLVCGLVGGLLGLYCFVGIILAILVALKVLK